MTKETGKRIKMKTKVIIGFKFEVSIECGSCCARSAEKGTQSVLPDKQR
jgi:hypothetical protein